MSQSFQETQYPVKVWAAVASAAIFAVALTAYLWLFFEQPAGRMERIAEPPAALQHLATLVVSAIERR